MCTHANVGHVLPVEVAWTGLEIVIMPHAKLICRIVLPAQLICRVVLQAV